MLFNSQEFVFLFLPLVWWVFAALRRAGRWQGVFGWLLAASLAFYGWWDPRYLALILGSIGVNYAIGLGLGRRAPPRGLLALGVAFNLGLLGAFKYANFALANWQALTGIEASLPQIVLPLGISFFTFQQIAYLVDVARGEPAERDVVRYALFVSFFPQLIAGPIVHFKQMMPAFDALPGRRDHGLDLAVGLSIFAIGLAKKVLIADSLAPHVGPVFDAPPGSPPPDLLAAWTALAAYTFQIYFDFSGYSDMAVGLARMFGITLPVNFFSPYKADSIAEFWRRWHMTLSAFLRDYLYIPLGGNRRGPARTAINLFLTMAIGGFWHGANWTFLAWGCWHGAALVAHRALFARGSWHLPAVAGVALTFLVVMLGWVWFRAPSMEAALGIHAALFGAHGVAPATWAPAHGWIALAALLAFFAPNTTQWFARHEPGLLPAHHVLEAPRLAWSPRPAAAAALALLAAVTLLALSRETVFLYFQF
jgi:D-alanyl-lipoteichoic acid acyltransferase DltB (MBOAT superfamily)